MKKLKGFTLVEILIVIVIIGILIAALLPRMSAAQGKARDVARKNELSQIQTALVAYNGDHGHYPVTNGWIPVSDDRIKAVLYENGFSDIPRDPQKEAIIAGIDHSDEYPGQYWYRSVTKNGVENGGFVLVAHMENPASANYLLGDASYLYGNLDSQIRVSSLGGWLGLKVYAQGSKNDDPGKGKVEDPKPIELNKLIYCDSIKEGGNGNGEGQHDNSDCSYKKGGQENMLVYVLAY